MTVIWPVEFYQININLIVKELNERVTWCYSKIYDIFWSIPEFFRALIDHINHFVLNVFFNFDTLQSLQNTFIHEVTLESELEFSLENQSAANGVLVPIQLSIKKHENEPTLNQLPATIKVLILNYLSHKELIRMNCINFLWKNLWRNDHILELSDLPKITNAQFEQIYKQFRKRSNIKKISMYPKTNWKKHNFLKQLPFESVLACRTSKESGSRLIALVHLFEPSLPKITLSN